jgi:hypothetical protein
LWNDPAVKRLFQFDPIGSVAPIGPAFDCGAWAAGLDDVRDRAVISWGRRVADAIVSRDVVVAFVEVR